MNGVHGINGVIEVDEDKGYGSNETDEAIPAVDSHAQKVEMKCEPPTGIDVLVVGAGLGGMFAAVELQRQGHKVRMLEAKEKMEGLGKLYTRLCYLPSSC